jgi:hypothetical protein
MSRPPSFCVDPYVVDTLMQDLVGHDHRPSAFIVYLFFLRRCAQESGGAYRASLAQIAEGTGLSRRAVQDAIAHLRRRKLLGVSADAPTAVPEYEVRQPWNETRRRRIHAAPAATPNTRSPPRPGRR